MSDDPILDRLRESVVGEIEHRPVVIVDPDPGWPERYEREDQRIREALGARVLRLEHVGSTAVPDLPAKPILDILLVVHDPAVESGYVPPLEDAGYQLRIREPDWHQHRMLATPARDVHVHVFGPESPEVDHMLSLRDHLRTSREDRELYASTKRTLAHQDWPTVQHYAEAKTEVIESILARAH